MSSTEDRSMTCGLDNEEFPILVAIFYGSFFALFTTVITVFSWILVLDDLSYKYEKEKVGFKFAFIQFWVELWHRRRCYYPLVIHIIDQSTDIGVVFSWLFLAIEEENGKISNCSDLTMLYLFMGSLLSILLYRIVSSILIFNATKSFSSALYQFFDLQLFFSIRINWQFNRIDGCNPQRWIHSLAAYQSALQSLLQLVFLFETDTLAYKEASHYLFNTLILVSFIFSVYSYISRVIIDDTILFNNQSLYNNYEMANGDRHIAMVGILKDRFGSRDESSTTHSKNNRRKKKGHQRNNTQDSFHRRLRDMHVRVYGNDENDNDNDQDNDNGMDIDDTTDMAMYTFVERRGNSSIDEYGSFNFKNGGDGETEQEACCFGLLSCFERAYCYRVLFRLLDISLRVFSLSLLWIVIGGQIIIAILCIEFISLVIASVSLSANELMLGMIAIPICRQNMKTKYFSKLFWIYRVISNVLFLLVVTVFILFEFPFCSFCEKWKDRRYLHFVQDDDTTTDKWIEAIVVLTMLCYSWLGSIAYPLLFLYISVVKQWVRGEATKGRQLQDLMATEDLEGIIELIEFGVKLDEQQYELERLACLKDWRRMNVLLVKSLAKLKVDFNCIRDEYRGNILIQLCQRSDDVSDEIRLILDSTMEQLAQAQELQSMPAIQAISSTGQVQRNRISMCGLDINEANKEKDATALHYAVQHSPYDTVCVLCEEKYGCDFDCLDDKQRRPLHFACQYASSRVVKLLTKDLSKIDVKCLDCDGNNIVHCACKGNNRKVLKYIIDSKFIEHLNVPNNFGIRASHFAAQYGDAELLQLLESCHIDLMSPNFSGNSALYYACKGANLKSFLYLCEKDEFLGQLKVSNKQGRTCLHSVCRNKSPQLWHHSFEIAKILIETHGLDCDATDVTRSTPLHYACENSSHEMVRLLLKYGDKHTTIKDHRGRLAQERADKRGNATEKNAINREFMRNRKSRSSHSRLSADSLANLPSAVKTSMKNLWASKEKTSSRHLAVN